MRAHLSNAAVSLSLAFLSVSMLSWAAPNTLQAASSSFHPDRSWRSLAVWDDGQAEVNRYDVTWAHYARHYPGTLETIVVKEPFDSQKGLKCERCPAHAVDVLKYLMIRRVPTGIYTYHHTLSGFVSRATGEPLKVLASSSEACGLSHASYQSGDLTLWSYIDGSFTHQINPNVDVLEDLLPLVLRDYVASKAPKTLRLWPSLLNNRYAQVTPHDVQVTQRIFPPSQTALGHVAATEFHLRTSKSWQRYRFEHAPPHRLISFETHEGTRYALVSSERLAYWKLNRPEDLPRNAFEAPKN